MTIICDNGTKFNVPVFVLPMLEKSFKSIADEYGYKMDTEDIYDVSKYSEQIYLLFYYLESSVKEEFASKVRGIISKDISQFRSDYDSCDALPF